MRHDALLTRSMPMRRPRRRPYQISSSDLPGWSSFITDPSFAVQYLKILAFFVRVPMGAGTWSKSYMTTHKEKVCALVELSRDMREVSCILTPLLPRIHGGACLGTRLL